MENATYEKTRSVAEVSRSIAIATAERDAMIATAAATESHSGSLTAASRDQIAREGKTYLALRAASLSQLETEMARATLAEAAAADAASRRVIDIEARKKDEIRAAWLFAGGDEVEFEAAYPALKQAHYQQLTLDVMRGRAGRDRLYDSF